MSKIVEKFKHTLKDLMEQKGIGVVELAKELNTSRFVVHKWLTQAKDMRFDSLLKLANYFNCSIEYLCGRTDVYLGYVPKDPPKFSDRLREVLAEHSVTSYRLFKDTKIILYYYSYAKNFDLGLIVQIFDKFNLAQQYGLFYSDITSIRVLRNKVMHHNMLLLSCFTERSDIEKVISEVESGIEALYRILPTKELRDGSIKDGKVVGGLTQAINKSNYPNGDINNQPYDNVICLHKFANGGFIR